MLLLPIPVAPLGVDVRQREPAVLLQPQITELHVVLYMLGDKGGEDLPVYVIRLGMLGRDGPLGGNEVSLPRLAQLALSAGSRP